MHLPVRQLPEYRGELCLNCGTPLEKADKYCHQCGQLNSKKRLSLFDFFTEFLANFISYDGRIWRTISGILFKPGKVTKEYCAGRRMHYANPFRFFLTVSIVFFLLGQNFLDWDDLFSDFVAGVSDGIEVSTQSALDTEEVQQLIARRDSLQTAGNTAASNALTLAIDRIESAVQDTVSNATYHSEKELSSFNFLDRYLSQTDDYRTHATENPNLSIEEALEDIGHEQNTLNISRYRKAKRFNDLENSPYLMVQMIVPKIPLFLFFFAPIISLFLWLIYLRRPFNFMEHLVFTFHIFTFFFLGMFIIMGIVAVTFGILGWQTPAFIILGIGGPIYFYKAMRKFYQQGRFKTLLKFAFINFVFFLLFMINATVFIAGSVFIGA
jgi:hypothetical protein